MSYFDLRLNYKVPGEEPSDESLEEEFSTLVVLNNCYVKGIPPIHGGTKDPFSFAGALNLLKCSHGFVSSSMSVGRIIRMTKTSLDDSSFDPGGCGEWNSDATDNI